MRKYLFIIIISLFLIPVSIYAEDSSISLSSSKTSVKLGDVITVKVEISSNQPIGYYEYTLDYDGSKLKLTNGSPYNVDRTNDNETKKITKSFKFKILKEGNSKISVKAYALTDTKNNNLNPKINPININTDNSSNKNSNYLSKLEVEGYKITPKFNKKTTNYKLMIDKNIKKVNIIAEPEDKDSIVVGDGIVNLKTGENKIEVKVESENVYTILISVKDENPIEINIDGETYTLIKDSSILDAPYNYNVKKETINGQEITVLYNKITKYTLVGLKDKEDNIQLYIYDSINNSYTIYKELQFDETIFIPIKTNEKLKDYEKYNVTINENDVQCYKLNSHSDFCLIYGMNANTGEENWYSYNESENTIQKYNSEIDDHYEKEIKDTQILIYILAGSTLLFGIIVILLSVKLGNRKRK